MAKVIIAIVALIVMILSLMPVSGQQVSYGYDQYGRINCQIYDYGNCRYINYGYNIGHWEIWNGYAWQYYFPNSNNYGSNSYSGNSHPQTSSSGHDYYAEQLAKNQAIYDDLAESQDEMNRKQIEGGWSPTGTLLP
jgi:hypothetical protein